MNAFLLLAALAAAPQQDSDGCRFSAAIEEFWRGEVSREFREMFNRDRETACADPDLEKYEEWGQLVEQTLPNYNCTADDFPGWKVEALLGANGCPLPATDIDLEPIVADPPPDKPDERPKGEDRPADQNPSNDEPPKPDPPSPDPPEPVPQNEPTGLVGWLGAGGGVIAGAAFAALTVALAVGGTATAVWTVSLHGTDRSTHTFEEVQSAQAAAGATLGATVGLFTASAVTAAVSLGCFAAGGGLWLAEE